MTVLFVLFIGKVLWNFFIPFSKTDGAVSLMPAIEWILLVFIFMGVHSFGYNKTLTVGSLACFAISSYLLIAVIEWKSK